MAVINFLHVIQNLSIPQCRWNRSQANMFVFRIKLFSDLIIKGEQGIMCRIPGTWHHSSTVNITVEESCQHRTKKKSCSWLLNNRASDCWRIMPVTVEESCQSLLNNRATDCWRIMPATVEESCQPLLNNRASDCWIIVPVTVEQSCQWLLNNRVEQLCQWLNNRASDCWTILPETVEEPW